MAKIKSKRAAADEDYRKKREERDRFQAVYSAASDAMARASDKGRELEDQMNRFQAQLDSGLVEGTKEHNKATKMLEFLEIEFNKN